MLLAVTPPQKGLVCFLVHWQSVRLAQTTALHWSSTTVVVVNNVHHGNSDLVAMKGFVTNNMIRTESQRCEGTKTVTAREVPTTKITPRQKPHTHKSKTLKEISQPPTPTRSATRQQPERPLPLEQHMNHLKSMFRGTHMPHHQQRWQPMQRSLPRLPRCTAVAGCTRTFLHSRDVPQSTTSL